MCVMVYFIRFGCFLLFLLQWIFFLSLYNIFCSPKIILWIHWRVIIAITIMMIRNSNNRHKNHQLLKNILYAIYLFDSRFVYVAIGIQHIIHKYKKKSFFMLYDDGCINKYDFLSYWRCHPALPQHKCQKKKICASD